jgi:hypothetical protein
MERQIIRCQTCGFEAVHQSIGLRGRMTVNSIDIEKVCEDVSGFVRRGICPNLEKELTRSRQR